jgi:AcrR family transcriptional regulator
MENSFSSDARGLTPPWEVQGVTEVRQRTIAAMIARGFSVKDIAKKLKMSESRIYHLLSSRDSTVNAEINRVLNELFADSDRRLINLYDKALQKLDSLLSSSDEEKQFRAIDRIKKIYLSRSAKNAVTIQQYFGTQAKEEQQDWKNRLDEIVLQKRRERGLPDYPNDNDL